MLNRSSGEVTWTGHVVDWGPVAGAGASGTARESTLFVCIEKARARSQCPRREYKSSLVDCFPRRPPPHTPSQFKAHSNGPLVDDMI